MTDKPVEEKGWQRWTDHLLRMQDVVGWTHAAAPLPTEVDTQLRSLLLDTIGCMLAGRVAPEVIAMEEQFGWTETTKGFVLSSFFVGYLILQVASGMLANRHGGRIVLGVAVVWWSLCTVLTPPAAMLSLPALIGARIALGLGEAAVFPASINMVGRWVPAASRSRAVALFTSALSLGTMFALPLTGWLVRGYGWPTSFYAFGAVGLVWAVVWFARIRDGHGDEGQAPAPPAHRRIPWGAPPGHTLGVGHCNQSLLQQLDALRHARVASQLLQDDLWRVARRRRASFGSALALLLRDGQRRGRVGGCHDRARPKRDIRAKVHANLVPAWRSDLSPAASGCRLAIHRRRADVRCVRHSCALPLGLRNEQL